MSVAGTFKSQSLNTDQGSSDPTPSKALKARELSGLFFQPPSKGSFLGVGRGGWGCLLSVEISEDRPLSADFQPVCQNGDLAVA